MLRIDTLRHNSETVVQVCGRIRSQDIPTLTRILDSEPGRLGIDLSGVTLVDAETVVFLSSCEERGVSLMRCPAYIAEWISLHQSQGQPDEMKGP
jgi:hypothetical protein